MQLPPWRCKWILLHLSGFYETKLVLKDYVDHDWEFCGGNIVADERRRFKLKNQDEFEEIEPITPWQNLSYIGDVNKGASICAVRIIFFTKNQIRLVKN